MKYFTLKKQFALNRSLKSISKIERRSSGKVTFFLSLILSLLLFNCSFAQTQIYQHNFSNIIAPSAAQLNTPSQIDPNLTSTLTVWGAFRRIVDGNRALAGKGQFHQYTLKLSVPLCQKLELTSISLKRMSGDNATMQIQVNNTNYGSSFSSDLTYTEIARSQSITDLMGEVVIKILVTNTADANNGYTSIDDLTIFGRLTNRSYTPGLVTFEQGASSEICQESGARGYNATVDGAYRTFSYTLDGNSAAAGVYYRNDAVFFPHSFSGNVTLTATATGCEGTKSEASHHILVKPGGLIGTETELTAEVDGIGNARFEDGCRYLGSLYGPAFYHSLMKFKVAFKNGIRYYELTPEAGTQGALTMILNFSESDFKNYSGTFPLPQSRTDNANKRNVRIRIYYEGSDVNGKPDLILEPERLEYGANWTFDLSLEINRPIKIFLSDAGVPLPVTIEKIEAKRSAEGNRISWTTSEETNFSHFEVEKSENPRHGFQYLATVEASGKNGGGVYNYTDAVALSGLKYYRLKMVDTDGSSEYSKIVSVHSSSEAEGLTVYPNPTQNDVSLESGETVKTVSLIDSKGRTVFEKSYDNQDKTLRILLPKLPSGEYFLNVNPDSARPKSRKIIVKQ